MPGARPAQTENDAAAAAAAAASLARIPSTPFAGNNALLLGGRIVVPASVLWTVLYANLVIIVQSCYSLALYERMGIWVWLISTPQLCLTLVCYLRAAFTDPGILARFRTANRAVPGRSQRALFQHCDRCQIWIQPQVRARHCDVCDNCIVVHDHHSMTLGTCVGQRNLRFYFVFLLGGNLLVLTDAVILALAAYIDRAFWTETPGVSQLLLLSIFAMPVLLIVWLVPFYSICKTIARGRPGCGPPQPHSRLLNFVDLFYEEIPPSQVRIEGDAPRPLPPPPST